VSMVALSASGRPTGWMLGRLTKRAYGSPFSALTWLQGRTLDDIGVSAGRQRKHAVFATFQGGLPYTTPVGEKIRARCSRTTSDCLADAKARVKASLRSVGAARP
jgi:hypothetical protein